MKLAVDLLDLRKQRIRDLERQVTVLREALEPLARLYEKYEQIEDLDAPEVVVPYVALYNAAAALAADQTGSSDA